MATEAKPIDKLLERLERVTPRGDGWEAECPAHDDRQNSLCLSQKSDGTILLHCQANCSTPDVLAKIGLELKDLFPPRQTNGRPETAYSYHDERGTLLYQAVRMEPKDFRVRTPNPAGGWTWKLNGARRVPYRLPELVKADPARTVLIVEGEKDADRLAAMGFVVTCNVGGAGKWRAEYSAPLAGRPVAILSDNDEPGRKHARQVARSLYGKAASVKVIEFPELPEKGDVSDWLDAGHSADDLKRRIIEAAEWEPTPEPEEPETDDKPADAPTSKVECTDRGNGRLLAEIGRGKILFCAEFDGWLSFDGTRWVQDEIAAERLAKTVPDELWQIGRHLENDAIRKWAQTSCSSGRIVAMLKMARSEPGMSITAAELNPSPWLLNCENGTVDLRSGKLQPHRPEDFITAICPTRYVPEADCPRFKRFLAEILDDAEVIGFLRRFLGYILTGVIREHVLAVLFGDGRNGKGTLVESICSVLGTDYTHAANADLLTTSGPARDRDYHVAELHGKRLAFCSESSEGRNLREEWVKRSTGNDTLTGRHPYGRPFNFRPSHKWLLQTNEKPRIEGVNVGIWSRIRLVEFNREFTGRDDDTGLSAKLQAEREGILAWMVEGCRQWQQDGLQAPEAVISATEKYRIEQDTVARFVKDCCETGHPAEFSATASELYQRFVKWAEQEGERQKPQQWFGRRMKKLFQRDEDARPIRYLGVRLHLPQDSHRESEKSLIRNY